MTKSTANTWSCVRDPGCSKEEALEAASLHPARLLGITHRKGTLDFGSDAGQTPLGRNSSQRFYSGLSEVCASHTPDLVLLNNNLSVQATYIAGEEVWRKEP